MQLKLYQTKSSNNVLNKKLESEKSFTIDIKNSGNLREPTIRLDVSGINILNYNYAYIQEFNRFYFIDKDSIDFISGTICDIKLRCDVLMTYKNEILNSNAIISRQQFKNQKYVIDNKKQQYAFKNIVTKTFPNTIKDSDFSYVLITA